MTWRADPSRPATAEGVPAGAAWLGGLGVVPFVALAAFAFADAATRGQSLYALAAYGAVILSFLGGARWGLALAAGRADVTARRLCLSTVPALVGWGALLLPLPDALLVLASGFAAMLLLDTTASSRGEAPAWYPRLRRPLSLIVVAALLIGAAL